MAKSDDDSDQEPTQPKTRKALRRGPLERARNSSPRPDEFKTKRNTKSTHLGEQAIPRDLGASTEFAEEVSASSSCGSANLEDHDTVALIILEPEQAAEKGTLSTTGAGLHEGDQNSINKTPVPRRHSSPPTSSDETIQLATPSSSPAVQTASKTNQAPVEATKPFEPAAAPKMKRRLTLHGDSYERQPSQKKRKAAPKRKDGVQTTLSLAIGSSAGMRECKLCDTVYNPLHPEDVKVHTKRHAIAVKRDRVSEEISGLAGSTLAD
ncbi:hypothetical protein DHEL01_v210307 [Diaporthe helianthi]|uniref:N-acetyltransferase ESCO zinc-finger domain-containing protein n=1 Tax=Diaporthe helianthi TaxID=158607 RepID=A0A2P5HM27_DIAHE|nr:hypothetical protein DHEL01_v210307 [Diaporthe helianthi]